MAKGRHRESQRIVLPNGLWLLIYEDGTVKLGGYDRRMKVTEVLNRDGGAHVFIEVSGTASEPRQIQSRAGDLVTVPRDTWVAIQRAL
ncbi:hypothetical protein [Mycobacteroides abscessus]|uniref:hypothetical protein n=1 Tax=Mycobacteroides abscessus TaxID=36809 RepID=UPI0009298B9F|nr:hypothetical protein [Mycobacteroides abscessus]MDO3071218.1 hypothetical protein [Mycobacteroides abscessus subsp. bolletii]MDO3106509.1 hypothetical protein [Mycobacteroides abscessus subsp. abscessus]SHV70603.1 Uncharacterised protein [Mycobacteroides abscessus subsp. abscessus]SKN79187.1 Uncharacterised protein [Mycobacteroides abscessus subsp. bolletii]SKW89950.1 Uncharacterised protein [Mycobacteroides abscessus subsp. bolletii]